MTKENIDELKELYDTLVELGVIFYYESEIAPHGEITDIEFNCDDTVVIELDGEDRIEVEVEEFIENHSKEGNNYHTWSISRNFDSKLSSI